MKKLLLSLLVVFIHFVLFAQKGYVHHWEQVIDTKDNWSIWTNSSEPDSGWFQVDYDYAQWETASGTFSFDNESTPTFYVIAEFDLEERDSISAMLFQADYSGGFVIYLNGHEVARKNMAGSFNHPAYMDSALYEHSYGEKVEDMLVHPDRLRYALVEGVNRVAIQVHHSSFAELNVADFYAYVGRINDNQTYRTPPDWFVAPATFAQTSELPIIYIDTKDQRIDSLSRITASMGVVYDETGGVNVFGDNYNHYDGQISIKYRGQSSLEFPKKSYSFETQTATGDNNNVAFLGLPEENDWVLYAPYSDKSLIRNVFTFRTFEEMGNYAPRTRFVELFLNGYYQGVYVLAEKIKRDKNRVDVSKLEPHEIWGDDLTGGYILRHDKGAKMGENAWTSGINLDSLDYRETVFQLQYPDPETVAPQQLEYIKAFCEHMEKSLYTLSYTGDIPDYMTYVDMDTWIDKFIINEISKDIDSYRYSEYMYKQKNSNGGKLVMEPIWDFNTGYGNVDYGTNEPWSTEGWAINRSSHSVFWYKQLFTDDYFISHLYPRWDELRYTTLSEDNLYDMIDSLTETISLAQERNHYQWNTLGRYVWPNYFVADTYEEEIDYLKDWLVNRLEWIDVNIPIPIISYTYENDRSESSTVWPNPVENVVHFSHESIMGEEFDLSISDMNGNVIDEVEGKAGETLIYNMFDLQSGVYLYTIKEQDEVTAYGRVVKL